MYVSRACFILSVIISNSFYICQADTNSDSPSCFDKFSEATLSEDGRLNFTGLATKYGLSVEQFDVQTEDGYILTLFHVTGDNQCNDKPPILLLHGIVDSADTYLIKGNGSWVVTLTAAGYDVWVGNSRGNLYSRRHITLDPDTDPEFWDYSFHEVGYYDLAAYIDFVRDQTGFDRIFTVGHSQGTTAHFVLTSLRPEYNDRIQLFIALAPVTRVNHLEPPVSIAILAQPAQSAILKLANINELYRNHSATSNIITMLCSKGILGYLACGLQYLFPMSGFDIQGIDEDFFTRVVVGHYPRGVSRKSSEHYTQVILRRTFGQFDYGAIINMEKYGSIIPPDYDLSAVKIRTALFVGSNDGFSKVKDAEELKDILPNVVHYEVMEPKAWNHQDFLWGKDIMSKHLYPTVLELLDKYT